MATWRSTRVLASAAPNATWRLTRVRAEGTAGPTWRLTRVAAESNTSNATWRLTRVAAEVQSSLIIPVANAGGALSGGVAELIQLDGTGSSATSGTITTYTWRFVTSTNGVTPTLSSTSASQPTFRSPISASPQQYTFGLIVHDSNGLQSTEDTVVVGVAGADLAGATSTGWSPNGVLEATSTGWK